MNKLKYIDKTILIITIIMSIFGLIMIYSASSASTVLWYHVASNHFVLRQLIALFLATVAGIIILFIPTGKYKKLIYPLLALVLFALVFVLVNGKVNHNAQSWIEIMGFSLQPSEFAKTIIIVFMAIYYHKLNIIKETKIQKYIPPLAIAGMCVVLIVLEQDLGSAFILFIISTLTFMSVPFIKNHYKQFLRIAIIPTIMLIIGLIVIGPNIFTKERISRFDFREPCKKYQEDTGYQVCNGLIAISNGGLFGAGLGKSSQKYMYLPESHTDFIFPIIVEELGALVGVLIICIYGLLLYRLWKNARQSENLKYSIICYGTFWYIASHTLVNILGVLALIPLTGVTLPFLSYGGSFAINAIILLSITQRCIMENKDLQIQRKLGVK